jgi:hypothetical protein
LQKEHDNVLKIGFIVLKIRQARYMDTHPNRAIWQSNFISPSVFDLKLFLYCQIDIEKSKCQVTFEDDSIYWVLFKHIKTGIYYSVDLLWNDPLSWLSFSFYCSCKEQR